MACGNYFVKNAAKYYCLEPDIPSEVFSLPEKEMQEEIERIHKDFWEFDVPEILAEFKRELKERVEKLKTKVKTAFEPYIDLIEEEEWTKEGLRVSTVVFYSGGVEVDGGTDELIVEVVILLRSGYYSGANFDYEIIFGNAWGDKFDELEERFLAWVRNKRTKRSLEKIIEKFLSEIDDALNELFEKYSTKVYCSSVTASNGETYYVPCENDE